jgi:Putative Se/S carrier protein-like
MLNWLKKIFAKKYEKPKGILLYGTVQEVILVNKMLANKGFQVRLVAPPPEVRVGCDLAIEFNLIEQEAVETLLKRQGSTPQKIVSTKEMLPDILKRSSIIEIDGHLMCKAGNMKITIDEREHRIVNISGGG